MNPWLSIYYMVSGKDANGALVNPNETISRKEALEIYTLGSAWFAFDEMQVGSIEIGKFADIVILDKDYFLVSEEDIKTIKSVLTVVDGNIVYDNTNNKN